MKKQNNIITNLIYKTYEKKLLKIVKNSAVPNHVAIIMDGNRRFAKEMDLNLSKAHMRGKDKLEEVLEWCLELDIKYLTVYAFSTENFSRSSDEVMVLMNMFEENLKKAALDDRVHQNKVRIRVIGDRTLLSGDVTKSIEYAEEKTKNYSEYHLTLAIGYGGREEIIKAIKEIANRVKRGELDTEQIDEDMFCKHLYTSNLPDPDLILRTSGEERISNFLLWQMAYSELYFADIYWPAFRKIEFLRAIRSYQLRQRRFGT